MAFTINNMLVFIHSIQFINPSLDALIKNLKSYLYAINVWNKSKMKSLGDYHDLHLKTDLLLLTNVFEKFITCWLKYYRLDPFHYFSSPGLSWDAILKMNGIGL